MILTRREILKEIKAGRLKIEPFDEIALGPASYDLTLDNKFRIFKRDAGTVFHVTDEADFEKITELVEVKDDFVLMPGETVHGITKERITLPDDICGWLQGRSRFARVGLMVHITAAFLQPGISNKQVLEMNNAGPLPLAIHAGTKVAQLIFERCAGRARYAGRFAAQEMP